MSPATAETGRRSEPDLAGAGARGRVHRAVLGPVEVRVERLLVAVEPEGAGPGVGVAELERQLRRMREAGVSVQEAS